MKTESFSRRDLLKSGGALIVSFAFGRSVSAQTGGRGALDLDSFLAVHADGRVTISTSRVDPGTGLTAVYRQLAAESLGFRLSASRSCRAIPPLFPITGEPVEAPVCRAEAPTSAAPRPPHVAPCWRWDRASSSGLRPS